MPPVYNNQAEDPGEGLPTRWAFSSEEAAWRRGARPMQVPYRAVPGSQEGPSYGFQSDGQTGFWNPEVGQVALSLFGWESFRWLFEGMRMRARSGRTVLLGHGDPTANRELALPDQSGTLATEADVEASADALTAAYTALVEFETESAEPTEDILPGMAVVLNASGLALRASDPDVPVGVAVTLAEPAGAVRIRVAGLLELADWTGGTGATDLAASAEWYLDADGELTGTPGTAHVLTRVSAQVARLR